MRPSCSTSKKSSKDCAMAMLPRPSVFASRWFRSAICPWMRWERRPSRGLRPSMSVSVRRRIKRGDGTRELRSGPSLMKGARDGWFHDRSVFDGEVQTPHERLFSPDPVRGPVTLGAVDPSDGAADSSPGNSQGFEGHDQPRAEEVRGTRPVEVLVLPERPRRDPVQGAAWHRQGARDGLHTDSHGRWSVRVVRRPGRYYAHVILLGIPYTTRACGADRYENDHLGLISVLGAAPTITLSEPLTRATRATKG